MDCPEASGHLTLFARRRRLLASNDRGVGDRPYRPVRVSRAWALLGLLLACFPGGWGVASWPRRCARLSAC